MGVTFKLLEMIKRAKLGIVFFFRDATVIQPYHEDISKLLNTCDLENIPLSTNQAGAELLIIGKIRMEASEKAQSKLNSNQ